MAENIADLHVLVLDCQATGANPQQGELLEIGWVVCHPGQPLPSVSKGIETHILRLTDGIALPPRIKRITGISDQDLHSGKDPQYVWKRLRKAALQVARRNKMEHCPVVIHFARYEAAFLEQLQQRFSNGHPLRFKMLCTHQIARRLLPGLPRKGLRAVAGFLGYAVAPPRRCAPHVAATFLIWKRFLPDLSDSQGVMTLSDLERWLQEKAPMKGTPKMYPLDRADIKTIPSLPGLYRFLRANGEVLYIGKSKSLNQRVRSYFHHRKGQGEHILEMLSQAKKVNYSCTETALEAALYESDAIKRYAPPYNQALQVGQRHVGVISWQLSMPADHRRNRITIGPVPEDIALRLLPDILEGYRNPVAGSAAYQHWFRSLNVTDTVPHLPPPDIFKAAIKMFHQHYFRQRDNSHADFDHLRSLGIRFWHQRLIEKTVQEESSDPDADRTITDAEDWTPQQGVRFIESLICRAAHLVRRAQWFGLLANCTLSWQGLQDSGDRYRTLVIKEGHIFSRGYCTSKAVRPPDCASLPPTQERQSGFSVGSYDRMRVLTSELKRIVAEGRPAVLQLGRRQIDSQGLIKTLKSL